MTSKERSWGRHAQGSRWERRREGRGRGWRAQRCSTRVQVHRAGRSTFAWRAKGTAWIFILTVERGCQVWEKKGGRETGFVRRQHPSSPSLLHLSVSVSFARKPRQPLSIPPSSLPPSLRFHAFPAGSELLFAREPRCRPLCLASVCILIVGPLSLLYLALPDVKKEREGERGTRGQPARSLSKQRFNDRGSFHGRAFFRGNEFHRRVSSS